jgi:NlpC/P60 family putative phage cell wall peptidase
MMAVRAAMADISRTALIAAARTWLGTPYQHQASVLGVGADCLGLVRGVWRACIGPEPQDLIPYAPDWADAVGADVLVQVLETHFAPRELALAEPGDVLAFRMAPSGPIKHLAILTDHDALLHAYWGRAVVESRFAPWWRQRCAAAAAFPGALPWPS